MPPPLRSLGMAVKKASISWLYHVAPLRSLGIAMKKGQHFMARSRCSRVLGQEGGYGGGGRGEECACGAVSEWVT